MQILYSLLFTTVNLLGSDQDWTVLWYGAHGHSPSTILIYQTETVCLSLWLVAIYRHSLDRSGCYGFITKTGPRALGSHCGGGRYSLQWVDQTFSCSGLSSIGEIYFELNVFTNCFPYNLPYFTEGPWSAQFDRLESPHNNISIIII